MNRTRRLTALAATASVGAAVEAPQAPCPSRPNQRPILHDPGVARGEHGSHRRPTRTPMTHGRSERAEAEAQARVALFALRAILSVEAARSVTRRARARSETDDLRRASEALLRFGPRTAPTMSSRPSHAGERGASRRSAHR